MMDDQHTTELNAHEVDQARRDRNYEIARKHVDQNLSLNPEDWFAAYLRECSPEEREEIDEIVIALAVLGNDTLGSRRNPPGHMLTVIGNTERLADRLAELAAERIARDMP